MLNENNIYQESVIKKYGKDGISILNQPLLTILISENFQLKKEKVVLEGEKGFLKIAHKESEAKVEKLDDENKELKKKIEELENQACRDPLTGAFNRREFDKRLSAEIADVSRHGRSLTLLMIDVDHFKKCNDNFGHVAGDKVLKSLVSIANDQFREKDLVCRYGGEEFIIILPETGVKCAVPVAERFRAAIEDTLADTLIEFGGKKDPLTVSIGIAAFNPSKPLKYDELKDMPKEERKELLIANRVEFVDQADKAMYEAKNTGRNRVMLAPQ